MPILLAAEDPPEKNLAMPEVFYEVWVKSHLRGAWWVYRAACETFDEAIELVDAYRKWYYVRVETRPRLDT